MPAFGNAYSDTEIAALANYVTGRFGRSASRITPQEVAELRSPARTDDLGERDALGQDGDDPRRCCAKA